MSNERAQRCCRLPGGVRIKYIRCTLTGSSSLDAASVTGSLLFYAPVCCLAVYCAAEFYSWVLFGGTDCIWLAGRRLFFRQVGVVLVMATDSAAAAGGRAGITFDVELVVPLDSPEPVVDLHSDGVMDFIGRSRTLLAWLVGSRVLQYVGFCREEMCEVCVLWFQIQGGWSRIFMTSLMLTWVIYQNRRCRWTNYHFSANNGRPRSSVIWCGCSKIWMQCARRPRNRCAVPRPGRYSYCNKWIQCDMYRHVATYHLDLAQLWRCQVSWCTV